MAVLVHDEDALDRPPHAKVFIVVLQALQPGSYAGIFLETNASSERADKKSDQILSIFLRSM